MEKNIKNIAGVSIVEIMVAMVLVALALVAIASVFPRMSTHGKAIHEADQARAIASEVLEGLQWYSKLDYPYNYENLSDPNNCNWQYPATATPNLRIPCQNICMPTFMPDGYDKFLADTVYDKGQMRYTVHIAVTNVQGNGSNCDGTYDNLTDGKPRTVRVDVYWKKNNKKHEISVTGVVSTRANKKVI